MRSMVKVTVVMPVYNAAKYIRKSLGDVLAQTMEDLEVICVDGGSRDGTVKIIRSFMERDSRVRLLSGNRITTGEAKNRGIREAKGEYITFWDADDRFRHRYLARMAAKMDETGADVAVCGADVFDGAGELYDTAAFLETEKLPDRDPFSWRDMPENIFDFATNNAWNKMFRRRFLLDRGIRFQNLVRAEDTVFVMSAMFLAERITWVDEKLVMYRRYNADSLTGRTSDYPLATYASFVYTREKLAEYPDFPAVLPGFQRRVLRGLLKSLDAQRTWDGYLRNYQVLQEEGLALFGLDTLPEEAVPAGMYRKRLRWIRTMGPEDYLLATMRQYRTASEKNRFRLRRETEKNMHGIDDPEERRRTERVLRAEQFLRRGFRKLVHRLHGDERAK